MTLITKRAARRAGFTMVEMLVVVTIIAILLSLTTAAVLSMIGTQQKFNTQTELTRLEGDLVRAYRSAADKFRKEPIPTSGPMSAAYTAVKNMAGGDPDRARVIWTKLRLKQTFPNNVSEALNPAPTLIGVPNIALSYYTTKLNAVGFTAANTLPNNVSYGTQPWESSVCLLLALQRGEGGGALTESDIGTGSLKDFGQTLTKANDPASGFTPLQLPIKGLVDNWGTPLAFCRWPVNSPVLALSAAQQAHDNNDSDDPSGLLEATSWELAAPNTLSNNAINFQNLCHPLLLPTATGQAQTFRITPFIVSAGPDKRLGLDKEPVIGGAPFLLIAPQPLQYFFGVQTAPLAIDNIYPTLAAPK